MINKIINLGGEELFFQNKKFVINDGSINEYCYSNNTFNCESYENYYYNKSISHYKGNLNLNIPIDEFIETSNFFDKNLSIFLKKINKMFHISIFDCRKNLNIQNSYFYEINMNFFVKHVLDIKENDYPRIAYLF